MGDDFFEQPMMSVKRMSAVSSVLVPESMEEV